MRVPLTVGFHRWRRQTLPKLEFEHVGDERLDRPTSEFIQAQVEHARCFLIAQFDPASFVDDENAVPNDVQDALQRLMDFARQLSGAGLARLPACVRAPWVHLVWLLALGDLF